MEGFHERVIHEISSDISAFHSIFEDSIRSSTQEELFGTRESIAADDSSIL